MFNGEVIDARKWQAKYKSDDYKPKLIFKDSNSKESALFSLSFFLMIMASEILFNQPFSKKIGMFHNNFYKKLFRMKYEKMERVETNSFAYSLFLILHKLLKEDITLTDSIKDIIIYATCHWSNILKLNESDHQKKLKILFSMWDDNKDLVLSYRDDSIIDLIFALYKSFELGISNKKIIEKNIAVLDFSVSKANKEFRYDVLNEFKKKF
mgnify:CR=1 FL=1